ncbi:TatD family hydrolase [Nocardioides taihuensis]|uniref:TatD family hydrolase n=1 Tax=Nocardioides taihuensis TaxID=1835606 RepID=A0ABW0BQK9_9ACTN
MTFPAGLPLLDCHAHIAPDVTDRQIERLGDVHVVAMTRSLAEANYASTRSDRQLTWAVGAHPGRPDALAQYNPTLFRSVASRFAVVGEVGLDRRGVREDQERVFDDVLTACVDLPVLISVHSTGRTREVVERVEQHALKGVVLHWFLGAQDLCTRAVKAGAYFSVNSAMPGDLISAFPRDRILPETDFPAKRVGAVAPGDTHALEVLLAEIWNEPVEHVRPNLWRNLRTISLASGAIDKFPEALADVLLSA